MNLETTLQLAEGRLQALQAEARREHDARLARTDAGRPVLTALLLGALRLRPRVLPT